MSATTTVSLAVASLGTGAADEERDCCCHRRAAAGVRAAASGASKNVELLDNLPEAKNATAINFLDYKRDGGETLDVMLVTGRFGLKSYSLADPAQPELLDEMTAEELRLPGDPPVDFAPDAAPSTFWQNEDMDVDQHRKLALLSRDPRAYARLDVARARRARPERRDQHRRRLRRRREGPARPASC